MAASGGITFVLGLNLLAAPAQGLIVLAGYAFTFGGLQITLSFRLPGRLKSTSLPKASPEN